MTKFDGEICISSLADKASDGLKYNNLCPAYKAIKHLAGSHKQPSDIPITKPDCSPCSSTDEVLDGWKTHYENVLNHTHADDCPELCDLASHIAADPEMNTDPSSLREL